MDNSIVKFLDYALAAVVVIPGIAAFIGARKRTSPKFKGPFDSHSKPGNFEWLQPQAAGTEPTTGKLSVAPEATDGKPAFNSLTTTLHPEPMTVVPDAASDKAAVVLPPLPETEPPAPPTPSEPSAVEIVGKDKS